MSDIRCVICARNQPRPGATICGHCIGRIDDNLARIAELTAWAASWLMPRSGHGEGGRSVPGSKPPLDVASLDACIGNDTLPVLESWERLIREEAALSPYGAATATEPATVARSVTWLRGWLLWASERVDFPIEDYAAEIRTLRESLEHLDPDHDRPEGERVPCPAPHPDNDGRICGYRLVVDMRKPADDVTCRRCGTITTGGRIILAALSDPDVTVWAYPADIHDAFGVPAATLRKWHERKLIRRNGNRYDVGAAWRRRMEA